MEYTDNGLKWWYGTSDAPAPLDNECSTQTRERRCWWVSSRLSPLNAVTVQYRVDDGPLRTVRAVKFKEDVTRKAEYFRAQLPDFWRGNVVSYLPIATSVNRRTPSAD